MTDADLVGYIWPSHTMILKPGVTDKLHDVLLGQLVSGAPFKVEVNGTICYEGVFTTGFSSLSQNGVVIVMHFHQPNCLAFELGYPRSEFRGKDPRGDARIKSALTALGKLRESEEQPDDTRASQD